MSQQYTLPVWAIEFLESGVTEDMGDCRDDRIDACLYLLDTIRGFTSHHYPAVYLTYIGDVHSDIDCLEGEYQPCQTAIVSFTGHRKTPH